MANRSIPRTLYKIKVPVLTQKDACFHWQTPPGMDTTYFLITSTVPHTSVAFGDPTATPDLTLPYAYYDSAIVMTR